jgi:hypothetical protein
LPESAPPATSSLFKVSPSAFDKKAMQADAFWETMNQYVVEDLSSDAYIEETYRILLDLINQPKLK